MRYFERPLNGKRFIKSGLDIGFIEPTDNPIFLKLFKLILLFLIKNKI